MKLLRRVLKLERNKVLSGPESVSDRYMAALDKRARQITGKPYQSGAGPKNQEVLDAVEKDFVAQLSKAELEELIGILEKQVFGDDSAAIDQARREAALSLDDDPELRGAKQAIWDWRRSIVG